MTESREKDRELNRLRGIKDSRRALFGPAGQVTDTAHPNRLHISTGRAVEVCPTKETFAHIVQRRDTPSAPPQPFVPTPNTSHNQSRQTLPSRFAPPRPPVFGNIRSKLNTVTDRSETGSDSRRIRLANATGGGGIPKF
ncbi:hypothetical protein CI109_100357 [Kwoniella shandongensis]|uniref:Uncharacterized protein n=1 Tax=Kwoniella shandongensis TaxID=1734106 RepID=A0AAJ8LCE0_9TREE